MYWIVRKKRFSNFPRIAYLTKSEIFRPKIRFIHRSFFSLKIAISCYIPKVFFKAVHYQILHSWGYFKNFILSSVIQISLLPNLKILEYMPLYLEINMSVFWKTISCCSGTTKIFVFGRHLQNDFKSWKEMKSSNIFSIYIIKIGEILILVKFNAKLFSIIFEEFESRLIFTFTPFPFL